MSVADGFAFQVGRALGELALFVGVFVAFVAIGMAYLVAVHWWERFKRRRDPRWWQ